MLTPVDLRLDGIPGAVSAWVVTDGEPGVVDPGPSTTVHALERGLSDLGIPLADLRHLYLTHVHLDHAGAAGHLARANPDLTVHAHPDALPHLADPARLVESTRRTFGEEAHGRLWGEVVPVPEGRLRATEGLPGTPGRPGPHPRGSGGASLPMRPVATPGHIAHHVSWLHEPTGMLAAGDAMGILLHPEGPVHPPTPPPGVDLEAWLRTLEGLETLGAERFGAAHFGPHEALPARARELAGALERLAERVEAAIREGREEGDAADFERETREAQSGPVPRERVERYFDVFAAATDWEGMAHHLRRRGR